MSAGTRAAGLGAMSKSTTSPPASATWRLIVACSSASLSLAKAGLPIGRRPR
eukprot:CAMPEP_0195651114 /NCGR_PEP_ID=MMETSP0815-20121206/32073_1 /TAXON_ID=97485 /ORGANISM="Prymnesium parvum, Strain Texoma1" /LENGTH=51 /DNA_ID=CAMNT_0040794955 /DNA_START=130 /DNA_END=281 /DNA_ORIENTATION=+